MIAQQTAKKEKLLDNFLKKHEAEYPFPEDVELICDIDYMGDGKPCHFMDIYRPRKIMKVLLLYLRETLEKEFVLSIYKSGKQRKLSETCHRHFWSQLTEILFEITADSMQKR